MSADADDELARIRRVYAERKGRVPAGFYAADKPENLFLRSGQERALVGLLARHRLTPLAGKRLLDIGCGAGQWLATFEGFGMARADLAGIDLDEERIGLAASRLSGIDVRAGDAARLPWPDASFDLVSQLTVFSSILDAELRRRVAAEMQRVLRPGGAVIWYDFFVDNPWNPDVRGVTRGELARLFPGWTLDLSRCTLAPPLARRIAPRSWTAATVLESLRLLNTHYMGLLTGPR